MYVFTVHRVHGRPVGLAEIGGDMRGAALESPARSLRCSEGVIGRLLFLSPPLLPWVFSSSGPADSLSSSLIPSRALTCMTGTRRERGCRGVKRGRGRETWRGGIQVKDSRQWREREKEKVGAKVIAGWLPASHLMVFLGRKFHLTELSRTKRIQKKRL